MSSKLKELKKEEYNTSQHCELSPFSARLILILIFKCAFLHNIVSYLSSNLNEYEKILCISRPDEDHSFDRKYLSRYDMWHILMYNTYLYFIYEGTPRHLYSINKLNWIYFDFLVNSHSINSPRLIPCVHPVKCCSCLKRAWVAFVMH